MVAVRQGALHHGHVMLALLLALSAPDLATSVTREVARQECRLRDEGEAITVCGRRDRQKRYQVTDPNAPYDPAGNVKGVMTERMGWGDAGDSGVATCSPVGPSAGFGCMQKEWRRQLQQKGWLIR